MSVKYGGIGSSEREIGSSARNIRKIHSTKINRFFRRSFRWQTHSPFRNADTLLFLYYTQKWARTWRQSPRIPSSKYSTPDRYRFFFSRATRGRSVRTHALEAENWQTMKFLSSKWSTSAIKKKTNRKTPSKIKSKLRRKYTHVFPFSKLLTKISSRLAIITTIILR